MVALRRVTIITKDIHQTTVNYREIEGQLEHVWPGSIRNSCRIDFKQILTPNAPKDSVDVIAPS
jgi:hypothetical protein